MPNVSPIVCKQHIFYILNIFRSKNDWSEKLLYDEFALVLDINPNEVLPFIRQQIAVTEKKYNILIV